MMAKTQNFPIEQLRAGNRRALAKAITLVESLLPAHREQATTVLDALMPSTGGAMRLGISGPPGVGKSSFIEAFGLYLIEQGRRVAVLAVDPSSPVGGGSILGDKTRMQELSRHSNAFIRPSPAAGALGGVTHRTRESILLCEAAGFDVVIVETVGVGQSEFNVAAMTDFFLVLMLPNAGDELQGIKKGIIELADALVINKADGAGLAAATTARSHFEGALRLLAKGGDWQTRVLTCSALENRGIDEIWAMIGEYHAMVCASGVLIQRRARQNIQWMEQLLADMIESRLNRDDSFRERRLILEQQVKASTLTPLSAAQQLLAMLW